jgi:hypothetical protein
MKVYINQYFSTGTLYAITSMEVSNDSTFSYRFNIGFYDGGCSKSLFKKKGYS